MHSPAMSNGDYMMHAYRTAQQQAMQQAINQHYSQGLASLANLQATNPYNPHMASAEPPSPDERPAEDVAGLRLLDEFLAKRKAERK